MNYSDYTTALGDLLQYTITDPTSATPSDNTDFNNILPRIIEAAEQRIYRELDFLATREEDHTTTLSTSSRQFTLPTAIIIAQSASVITPASTAPSAGKRNPLFIVAKDVIDQIWPSESSSKGMPQYMAMLSNTVGIVAPTADDTYELEITGIYRPAALSSTNTSTYITLNYPDLFIYASMVFASGFQRDFGAQATDGPGMSVSWESQYQIAKQSTLEEEQRRKSQGTNWTPFSSTPLSSPRK